MATIVYLTLGVVLARAQVRRRMKAYVLLVAVGLAVIVGFSRVYLGVHWPTDVLAGWCVGASWAIACLLVETLLQRRGAIERASDAGASERHIGGGI
jgi:undecaprenyl-diphosphatase